MDCGEVACGGMDGCGVDCGCRVGGCGEMDDRGSIGMEARVVNGWEDGWSKVGSLEGCCRGVGGLEGCCRGVGGLEGC